MLTSVAGARKWSTGGSKVLMRLTCEFFFSQRLEPPGASSYPVPGHNCLVKISFNLDGCLRWLVSITNLLQDSEYVLFRVVASHPILNWSRYMGEEHWFGIIMVPETSSAWQLWYPVINFILSLSFPENICVVKVMSLCEIDPSVKWTQEINPGFHVPYGYCTVSWEY